MGAAVGLWGTAETPSGLRYVFASAHAITGTVRAERNGPMTLVRPSPRARVSPRGAQVAKGGLRLKPAADPKHGEMSFSRGHLSGRGVPISFLASLLALPVGHTVVNRTGVTGAYDFDLRFDSGDNPAGALSNDPDLFTAVQEQLGVKLQSTHAPLRCSSWITWNGPRPITAEPTVRRANAHRGASTSLLLERATPS